MAMRRRRKRARQEALSTPKALPVSASHPFYHRLNQILDEKVPDHSSISSSRRLMDLEANQAVFPVGATSVGRIEALKCTGIGEGATTLETKAALRSFVRHDTGATKSSSGGWSEAAYGLLLLTTLGSAVPVLQEVSSNPSSSASHP